jgi:hypothetical protein
MVKRIAPEARTFNVADVRSLADTVSHLSAVPAEASA